MKSTVVALLVCSLIISCSSNPNKYSTTQYSNVEIQLKDGTKMQGKLNFPIYFDEKKLYLSGKQNKKIATTTVNKVVYNTPACEVVFENHAINNVEISNKTNNFQLLQLISKGKINLYQGYNSGFVYSGKKSKFYNKTFLIYAKRGNEVNPTLIYYDDNQITKQELFSKAEKYLDSQRFILSGYEKTYNHEILIKSINNYNNEKK